MNIKAISVLALTGAMAVATPAQAQIFGDNTGRTLLGAGIGAGLGGVLGSNLAGTGVQQEGTAIGAVLGGLIGAGIANSGSNHGSYGHGYGHGSGFSGGMTGQPYMGGGYSQNFGTFGGTYMAPPAMPAPQYVHGGYVNAGSYTTPSYTNYVYHPAPQPIVQTHRVVHQQPVYRKTVHLTQPQRIIRKTVHVTQPKYIDVVEHKTLPPVNV